MTALEGKALLEHGKLIARRYAGRVGHEAAEELRAEAIARAIGRPPPDGRIGPWLERIYRNLLVDRWRHGHPTIEIDEARTPSPSPTPEEHALGRERRRAVRASLRGLPRDSRRALLSRFYGDLDDELAAARFGISPTTVRTRVHRALTRLRRQLGDMRAWFPPLFGRLGVQTLGVGAAPAMVAALLVSSALAPAPPVPVPVPAPPAITAPRVVAELPAAAPLPAPVSATMTPTARLPRKRTPVVAETSPVPQIIVPPEVEPHVGVVLEPDGFDIFAEPEKPALACLVERPPHFLAQIDRMIEEQF